MTATTSVSATEATGARGNADPSLALGLSGLSDWTTQLPFIDLAKSMRTFWAAAPDAWSSMSHEELRASGFLDANGWPKGLPPGMSVIRTVFASDGPAEAVAGRAGVYVLIYEGEGTLALGGNVRVLSSQPGKIVYENVRGGQYWLDIQSTDPHGVGAYVRDISIVRQEHVELHEAGALFNPAWLDVIGDARQVRFMDWMQTNGSDHGIWAERPTPDDATWTPSGPPVEVMVRLANEVGVDPWFTMPHLATSEYVRNFATYVRDHLDPKLVAHVEYTNEAWNFVFPQTQWLADQAKFLWGTDQWHQYHAKRATEVALLWDSVFEDEAEARVTNVLGTQSTNPWITQQLLEASIWSQKEPGQYVRPATIFDAISPASYFGGAEVSDVEIRRALLSAITDPALDEFEFLAARLRDPAYPGSIPRVLAILRDQAAVADRYGLDMIAYEGGQHAHHLAFVGGLTEAEVTTLTDFMTAFVRSPQMAELYQELWDGWRQIGDGPFMQFVDVQVPSKWGSWGLLSHLGDSNPRAELLFDLNASTPAWWEDRGGVHFQQGVTQLGTEAAERFVGTAQEDYLIGGGGDDTVIGGAEDDGLHGGAGTDTAVFSGAPSDYSVAVEDIGHRIVGPDGSDRVVAIERFVFDGGLELDLAGFVAAARNGGGSGGTPPDGGDSGGTPGDGTIRADVTGGAGDDVLIFRTVHRTAWGGDGADVFRVDARLTPGGANLRVLDLDFAEGDRLELRQFASGMFSDARDPGNSLSTGAAGRNATIDSLADLREIARGPADLLTAADGDAVLVLPREGGAIRIEIDGLKTGVAATTAMLTGTAGNDQLVFRAGTTAASGGAGADVFRIDARAVGAATLKVIDLDFAEGDQLDLRHFAPGLFDNNRDPANLLATRHGGRHAMIDGWGDLREIARGQAEVTASLDGDVLLALPAGTGRVRIELDGLDFDRLA